MTMPDNHYVHPRLAALYDTYCGWSPDRDFYFALPAGPAQTILDLGCGTGLLCDAYAAAGHTVTGADPAQPMLDVARQKPHGNNIEWAHATAETFRSPTRFDLIIMTGHAFQVLLTDDAVATALTTMRDHLKPAGRAVFESRNPAIDWAWEWKNPMFIETPSGPVHITGPQVEKAGEFISFDREYRFADETLTTHSRLRFMPKPAIEAHLAAAGLTADKVYGDWNQAPYDPATSHEIIISARPA